jgi:uncharacterized NAD(P)/FAD-binding protein YdhS
MSGSLAFGARAQPGFLLSATVQNCGCPEFHDWLLLNADEVFQELSDSNDILIHSWITENKSLISSKHFEDMHIPRKIFGRFAGTRMLDALYRAEKSGVLRKRTVLGEAVNITQDGTGYKIKLASGDFFYSQLVVVAIGNSWPRVPPHLVDEPRYFLSYANESLERLSREGPDLLTQLPEEQRRILLIGSRGSALEWVHYLRHQPRLLKLACEISIVSPRGGLPELPKDYCQSAEILKEMGLLTFYPGRISSIHQPRKTSQALVVEFKENPAAQPVFERAAIVVNCSGRGPIEYTSSRLLNNLAKQPNIFPMTPGRDSFIVGTNCEVARTPNTFVIGPLLTPENFREGVDSISTVNRVANELSGVLLARLGGIGDPH